MRVERCTRLENAIGEAKKLTHDSATNDFGLLASEVEASDKITNNRIAMTSRFLRHEEERAQAAIADFAKFAVGGDLLPRMRVERGETSVGSHLGGRVEAIDVGNFSKNADGGDEGDGGNGREQVNILFEVGMLVYMVTNESLERGDLVAEKSDIGLDIGNDRRRAQATLQTVEFADAAVFEVVKAANHLLKLTDVVSGRLPEIRLLCGAIVGDEPRILQVSLVTLKLRLSVTLDVGGIDHADGMTTLIQAFSQQLTIATCCFHSGVTLLCLVLFKPLKQAADAVFAVLKAGCLIPFVTVQCHIDSVFTDVDSQCCWKHDAPMSLSVFRRLTFRPSCLIYMLSHSVGALDTVHSLERFSLRRGLFY